MKRYVVKLPLITPRVFHERFGRLPSGQHVGGCHPHGKGPWLDCHGEGIGLLGLLLGLFPYADPCGLAVNEVRKRHVKLGRSHFEES